MLEEVEPDLEQHSLLGTNSTARSSASNPVLGGFALSATAAAMSPIVAGSTSDLFNDSHNNTSSASSDGTATQEGSPCQPPVFHCRDDQLFCDPVDEEYMCSIGRGVLVDPVMAPCQHEFCDNCIRENLAHRRECPLCRRPLSPNDLVKAYKTSRMVVKLRVYCDNKVRGCPWDGKWMDLMQHRETCPYELVQCQHEGCPAKDIVRQKLVEHTAQCQYRPTPCCYCKTDFPGPELRLHEEHCPHRPVSCPQKCGLELPLASMADHVRADCPFTLMPCPFAVHGCTATSLARDALEAHMKNSTATHLTLLSLIVLNQQNVIKAQDEKIERLTRRTVVSVGPPGGPFPFHSITEAISNADVGDTVVVHPGLYRECITLTKPISIVASGPDVIIENGSDSNVFLLRAPVQLSGLTLRQRSRHFFCVRVLTDDPSTMIENCDISSEHYSCVQIDSHANPTLRNNRIHSSKQCGILLKKSAGAHIYGNEIHSNHLSNVYVDAYANPTVRENKIYSSMQHGVWVKPKGMGVYEGNTIYGNAMSNVKAEEGAKPVLRRNLCTYTM